MDIGRHAQARICLLALLWATFACAAPAPAPPPKLALDEIGFLPAEGYDIGEGLPDLSVVAAAVTPSGQAWLGTMRGLVRYNSRRFVAEPGPGGVFNGAIRDIAATSDGRVWVMVPSRGVFVREAGQWRDVGKGAGLAGDTVVHLRAFEQRAGYRLFATGRGALHEWDGSRWQPWALPEALAKVEIFDVLLQAGNKSEDDLLWVASFGKGLWRCQGRKPCEVVPMTVAGPALQRNHRARAMDRSGRRQRHPVGGQLRRRPGPPATRALATHAGRGRRPVQQFPATPVGAVGAGRGAASVGRHAQRSCPSRRRALDAARSEHPLRRRIGEGAGRRQVGHRHSLRLDRLGARLDAPAPARAVAHHQPGRTPGQWRLVACCTRCVRTARSSGSAAMAKACCIIRRRAGGNSMSPMACPARWCAAWPAIRRRTNCWWAPGAAS